MNPISGACAPLSKTRGTDDGHADVIADDGPIIKICMLGFASLSPTYKICAPCVCLRPSLIADGTEIVKD
jgi:hypothetical protein